MAYSHTGSFGFGFELQLHVTSDLMCLRYKCIPVSLQTGFQEGQKRKQESEVSRVWPGEGKKAEEPEARKLCCDEREQDETLSICTWRKARRALRAISTFKMAGIIV